jgi:hypothetical protein
VKNFDAAQRESGGTMKRGSRRKNQGRVRRKAGSTKRATVDFNVPHSGGDEHLPSPPRNGVPLSEVPGYVLEKYLARVYELSENCDRLCRAVTGERLGLLAGPVSQLAVQLLSLLGPPLLLISLLAEMLASLNVPHQTLLAVAVGFSTKSAVVYFKNRR